MTGSITLALNRVHEIHRMPVDELPRIALIADAHYHCLDSDYGASFTLEDKPLALRSWADTQQSSRVFNESDDALNYTLRDIHRKGIRHVALLGDYTDDGQLEATQRLVDLLTHYQDKYGMAFFALPGNHDVYGPAGKHQSTRLLGADGGSRLVTSDPDVAATEPDNAILSPSMYCPGYSMGLQLMARFGYFRQPDHIHWESPFGVCDAESSRLYQARSADGLVVRQLMDASYLVEPVNGLWLLMIDANVFEPRNGNWRMEQKKAFLDSSDAGWNSVLRNKPHLITWITDVCDRATRQGKQLIACSHYPVLDVFNDASDTEQRLFGNTTMVRRRPSPSVARTVAATGLEWHFGGHLHVNGLTRYTDGSHTLTDIAVPSPASFPPGYKVVDCSSQGTSVETVPLYDMPLNLRLTRYYQEESLRTEQAADPALSATSYGEFLYQRESARTLHRHLPKDWPAYIARHIPVTTTLDLAAYLLAQHNDGESDDGQHLPVPLAFERLSDTHRAIWTKHLETRLPRCHLTVESLEACSMLELVTDWYRLRQAGDQAPRFVSRERLAIHRYLSNSFGNADVSDADTAFGFFSLFLGQIQQYLDAAFTTHPDNHEMDTHDIDRLLN